MPRLSVFFLVFFFVTGLIFVEKYLNRLLAEEAIEKNQTAKPFLGVQLEQMKVIKVIPNSTASNMGIKEGDILKAWLLAGSSSVRWQSLNSFDDIRSVLSQARLGDEVTLKISRNSQNLVVAGTLKAKPKPESLEFTFPPLRGILNQKAPAWEFAQWFQTQDPKKSPQLEDYKGKTLVLFCFQHWCPGCHNIGFPVLKKAEEAFWDDDSVQFLFVQTTFEGASTNTFNNGVADIKKYGIKSPFAQDSLDANNRSVLMSRYRTGGTPWIVVIDPQGIVRFNDFHYPPANSVDEATKALIAFLQDISS